MKSTPDEAAQFREACIYWQEAFGLKDWTLQFKTADGTGKDDEAEVDYDCETRHACITYYMGVVDALHPEDVALHEMLHVLNADMLYAAVATKDEGDPALGREEHKQIERLLKVLRRDKR